MYDYKCDIKLTVAGANFKAHRDVLAEASDYFSAMFSHDMLEKEQDVIQLHGISPGGFSIILDYFYHGHVTIDHDNIEDVLEVWSFCCCCCKPFCDIYKISLCLEQYVLVCNDTYWSCKTFICVSMKDKNVMNSVDVLFICLLSFLFVLFCVDCVLSSVRPNKTQS